jgi:hypothetical protein
VTAAGWYGGEDGCGLPVTPVHRVVNAPPFT